MPMIVAKGFTCSSCGASRLFVETTRRPTSGLIVRYRRCECGFRVVTEERLSKTRRSGQASTPAAR